MHVVTSRGSKKRNAIYWVKNFDDIGKVFTTDRLDDFKSKIIPILFANLPISTSTSTETGLIHRVINIVSRGMDS